MLTIYTIPFLILVCSPFCRGIYAEKLQTPPIATPQKSALDSSTRARLGQCWELFVCTYRLAYFWQRVRNTSSSVDYPTGHTTHRKPPSQKFHYLS